MTLRSNPTRWRFLTPLLALSLVPACADPGKPAPTPIAISASDNEALNQPMPGGSLEALTDPVVKAQDDAAIEEWGQKITVAWGRACRVLRDQGVLFPVGCPL